MGRSRSQSPERAATAPPAPPSTVPGAAAAAARIIREAEEEAARRIREEEEEAAEGPDEDEPLLQHRAPAPQAGGDHRNSTLACLALVLVLGTAGYFFVENVILKKHSSKDSKPQQIPFTPTQGLLEFTLPEGTELAGFGFVSNAKFDVSDTTRRWGSFIESCLNKGLQITLTDQGKVGGGPEHGYMLNILNKDGSPAVVKVEAKAQMIDLSYGTKTVGVVNVWGDFPPYATLPTNVAAWKGGKPTPLALFEKCEGSDCDPLYKGKHKVTVPFANWKIYAAGLTPGQIPKDLVTGVDLFVMGVKPDGTPTSSDPNADAQIVPASTQFISENPTGRQFGLTVGGYGQFSNDFAALAKIPTALANNAQMMATFAKKVGANRIVLDIENWDQGLDNVKTILPIARAYRAAFGPDFEITAMLPAGIANAEMMKGDLNELVHTLGVDPVPMLYDYYGGFSPKALPIAPYKSTQESIATTIDWYKQQGVTIETVSFSSDSRLVNVADMTNKGYNQTVTGVPAKAGYGNDGTISGTCIENAANCFGADRTAIAGATIDDTTPGGGDTLQHWVHDDSGKVVGSFTSPEDLAALMKTLGIYNVYGWELAGLRAKDASGNVVYPALDAAAKVINEQLAAEELAAKVLEPGETPQGGAVDDAQETQQLASSTGLKGLWQSMSRLPSQAWDSAANLCDYLIVQPVANVAGNSPSYFPQNIPKGAMPEGYHGGLKQSENSAAMFAAGSRQAQQQLPQSLQHLQPRIVQ